MQPYPPSPDLVWTGQLHGTGCLSARALDTGFPTVVWCLCLGPGCGWVWVSVTSPVLAGVSGGCVRVRFVVSSLFCRLGFAVFAVRLGFRPTPHLSWLGVWDVRGCVRALPAPRRSRFRCAVWACVLGSGFRLRPATPWGAVWVCVRSCARPAWSPAPPGWGCCAGVCGCCCAPPLLARASGLCVCLCPRPACNLPFLAGVCCVGVHAGPGSRLCPALLGWVVGLCFFLWGGACLALALWRRSLAVPVPGLVVPAPPSPLFRAGLLGLLFFSSQRGVCLRVSGVPFPDGPLLLVWCCWFWLAGPPVPLCGVLSSVPSGWGVWPPLAVLVGGLVAVGRSLARPPPMFLFFGGGSACSSLCPPWAGARTGPHSV